MDHAGDVTLLLYIAISPPPAERTLHNIVRGIYDLLEPCRG